MSSHFNLNKLIVYTTSNSTKDLEGILSLQSKNLIPLLNEAEKKSQGFVTVKHSYEQLSNLNLVEEHVIAKFNDEVVGYVLTMTKNAKFEIPVLVPMFDVFDDLVFNNQKVSNCQYMVVGQVCIDKQFRGAGVFDTCYQTYKNTYSHKYEFAITEIDQNNTRSLNAHARIGFKPIATYTADNGVVWVIVIWDWKN